MNVLIENYVAWAFNENSYYGSLYKETSLIVTHEGDDIDDAVLTKFRSMYHLAQEDLAYLAYEIIDCGMKDNAEWYKVAVRYVTEEGFWAADRRRKNVLYG